MNVARMTVPAMAMIPGKVIKTALGRLAEPARSARFAVGASAMRDSIDE